MISNRLLNKAETELKTKKITPAATLPKSRRGIKYSFVALSSGPSAWTGTSFSGVLGGAVGSVFLRSRPRPKPTEQIAKEDNSLRGLRPTRAGAKGLVARNGFQCRP